MNHNASKSPQDDRKDAVSGRRPADPIRTGWRRELRALREAIGDRDERERQLAAHVEGWLAAATVRRIGFFWPTRAEPNLAPLVGRWLAADPSRVASLPVIEGPLLRFAPWTPATELVRGPFDVMVPPTAERIEPEALLIPCVGIDRLRYRLGYGGGYYDRTLAQLSPRPLTVGIGFDCARIESIDPKPHDQRMDLAITETGRW
jgi:5-formyltetrahydrofolate cyclo-ligase